MNDYAVFVSSIDPFRSAQQKTVFVTACMGCLKSKNPAQKGGVDNHMFRFQNIDLQLMRCHESQDFMESMATSPLSFCRCPLGIVKCLS